jgi:hypothetical protein
MAILKGMPKSKPPRKKYEPPITVAPSGFGFPAEWQHFLTSNPKRIRAIEKVLDTLRKYS